MDLLEIGFWLAAACVVYTYAGYPLCMALLSRLRRRPLRRTGERPRSMSFVVAAHNEERSIDRRLAELAALIDASGVDGEVILVSDGSTDGTVAVARAHTKRIVRVLETPAKSGKAAALSLGCAAARHEILVFTDVRQTWAPDALPLLLENFADPAVGAVSGDLVLERAPGVLAGVGLYWRFEKWLRRRESLVWSMVGATGAVSAVRRELFRPVPEGTILDDVYWPLQVALQGRRVIHDDRAHAFDRLPDTTRHEFRRKVRTLAGSLQLATRLPAALVPWRNPIWIQFVSHKLLRLVAPWCLLALLAASLTLPGPLYQAAFWCQAACYLVALLGLWAPLGRFRPAAAAASFLVLNAAAFVAFWVWATGRTDRVWTKASYAIPRPSPLPPSPLGGEGSAVRGDALQRRCPSPPTPLPGVAGRAENPLPNFPVTTR